MFKTWVKMCHSCRCETSALCLDIQGEVAGGKMENTLVSCCEKIGSLTWCLMVLKCISPNLVTSSYPDSGGKGERGSTYFTGQLVGWGWQLDMDFLSCSGIVILDTCSHRNRRSLKFKGRKSQRFMLLESWSGREGQERKNSW